jgi:ABC-type transport system involved in multi-copper enzyme maturation permease subunit
MLLALGTGELVTYGTLGVLGLLVLVMAGVLIHGLFTARSLLRREFSAYFLSPIAYVVLVLFLVVTGHLFYLTLQQLTATGPKGVEFPMQLMLGDERFWLVYLFIPPLLTMRLFAEERSTGTLEMLMTAPVKDWQIVLTKYLACFAFYVLLWLPTLVYLFVLLDVRTPVVNPTWTRYTVLLLAGGVGVLLWLLLLVLPKDLGLGLLIVVGVVCALAGYYFRYLPPDWLPRAVEVSGILWTFGICLLFLYLLSAVVGMLARFEGATILALLVLLLLASGAAIARGAWGHYHVEREALGAAFRPLIEIPTGIDLMPVLSSYLGLALAGAMFLALGLFVSSLVRSQMVAALVSLVLSLLFIVAGFWRPDMDTSSPLYQVLFFFSVPLHFSRDFSRGLIDTRHLVLYGSVALFCLFLTVRSLESRRWR